MKSVTIKNSFPNLLQVSQVLPHPEEVHERVRLREMGGTRGATGEI